MLNEISDVINKTTGSIALIMIFFQIVVAWRRAKDLKVQSLSCAPSHNNGQKEEIQGELMHHHGHRIDKSNDLKMIGEKHPVWEWSRKETGRDASRSTVIYGPYFSTFDEPGIYRARYRIIAKGFQKPPSGENLPLLLLDILRTQEAFYRPENTIKGTQHQVSARIVFFDDLADEKKGHEFDLSFHYPGEDLWEFRVTAFDGTAGRPDNIAKYGESVRIFFDSITIFKIRKFKFPWE